MKSQQENVLRTLEERNIRFVRLWFTDIQGYLKSVAIAPSELESAFAEGIGFDGSAIEGFSRVFEADMIAMPDPSTFQILPFNVEDPSLVSARIFCDIAMPNGQPSFADPRQVLRRQIKKASEEGFSYFVHPEIEFFLVDSLRTDGQEPTATDNGGYFDQQINSIAPNFRQNAISALESAGMGVEYSHHEAAPGQQEIDLRFADALTMADNVMSFRFIIKQVAMQNHVAASFMPKPFHHQAGSAMHTHLSLFEGEDNAFHDPDDEYRLSGTAKSFIAGILEHASEISAVTNQWVNSYNRLTNGGEAPVAATWGVANRSAMIRVPMTNQNKGASRRIEVRTPDSACNPYLAYSVLFAAGLKGVNEGYELAPASMDDVAALSRRERLALGYKELPDALDQALREMEKSELVADTLGEHVFEYFLRNKWQEYADYRSQVTPWEIRTTLDY